MLPLLNTEVKRVKDEFHSVRTYIFTLWNSVKNSFSSSVECIFIFLAENPDARIAIIQKHTGWQNWQMLHSYLL